MASEEIKAVAQRLRKSCMDTIRNYPHGNVSFEEDCVKVIDAYLADHPEDDDDEPIQAKEMMSKN